MEFIKIAQGLLMINDAQMYSVKDDQKCKVMSVSLNEELGMINNIFTDKTGTLTSNEMIFKACSVGREKYDESVVDDQELLEHIKEQIKDTTKPERLEPINIGPLKILNQSEYLNYFWLALCTCHEIISISKNKQKLKQKYDDNLFLSHNSRNEIEESENPNSEISDKDIDEDDELVYHGMSPDEITLVEAAKQVGYEFRFRSNNEIIVKIQGEEKVFKLLKLVKFTAERKCMTVVIQDPESDLIFIFTKGADSVLKSLSYQDSSYESIYVDEFSKQGYRTLIVGMKVSITNQLQSA
jgi:magnesium-transporting ATPase (P-type)